MGLLKHKPDYTGTLRKIAVGQAADFILKGRMHVQFLNSIAMLQRKGEGRWTTRTHNDIITITRLN